MKIKIKKKYPKSGVKLGKYFTFPVSNIENKLKLKGKKIFQGKNYFFMIKLFKTKDINKFYKLISDYLKSNEN